MILWRVLFPVVSVLHLAVTWWLMGIWFEVEGTSSLDPVVHVWCCFTHFFNMILVPISFRHNLEFHIPFALGSVTWSAVLTCIIAIVHTTLRKQEKEGHPNHGVAPYRR
jgi:hypothetical protein